MKVMEEILSQPLAVQQDTRTYTCGTPECKGTFTQRKYIRTVYEDAPLDLGCYIHVKVWLPEIVHWRDGKPLCATCIAKLG